MAIDMSRDVDRLRGELHDIRKEVKKLTRTLHHVGMEKGQDALDSLEHYGKRARKRAARTEARIEREIEERPIISVLAAFGVGFLLAKLLNAGR